MMASIASVDAKHLRRKLAGSAVCVGLILLPLSGASAQISDERAEQAGSPLARIEIGRHQRLIETRSVEGAALAAFVTDGCSGGLSVGWDFLSSTFPAIAERHGDHPPWEDCCVEHDRHYHAGGPPAGDAAASFAARLAADEAMHACVIETGEARTPALQSEYGMTGDQVRLLYKGVADVMYGAVRLGGAPCSGFAWRWGFGWPQCQ